MVVPTASAYPLPGLFADFVALAVHWVVGELVHSNGPERVEPDVQRDPLDVEPIKQLRREVQAGRRRCGRAIASRVDRLVALRVLERLGDVGRERSLSGERALEPQAPAALAERLQELDRAEPLARPELARGSGETFPGSVLAQALQEQHLRLTAAWALEPQPGGEHSRVVDDDERSRRELLGQLVEAPVPGRPSLALVDQESRVVPPLGRMLRDQLAGQLVVELGHLHPTQTVPLAPMTDDAIDRARERLREAAEGRPDAAAVYAALERARAQVEELAQTAASLDATIPAKVEGAVEDGLRAQVQPVGRNLAEIRGLMNQVIRRLERVEGDLLSERHARIDDLALQVDLITSGWKSVNDRLASLEHTIQTGEGAIVYRIEERRAG